MVYPIEALKNAASKAGVDWRDVVRKKIAYAEYTGAFWLASALKRHLDN